MEPTQNAINWFEIPVTDFNRAQAFYSAIFDYQMPDMPFGPTRMGFLPHDQQTGIGGAIVQGPGYEVSTKGPKVYLNGGPDLSTILNRVEQAGGTIVQPKTQISPEFGYFATFQDPEGNHVSLHSMA